MSQPDYRAAVAAGVKRSAAQCIRRDSPTRPLSSSSSHNPTVPHQQPAYQHQHSRNQQSHHQPHHPTHYKPAQHVDSHDKKRAVAPQPHNQQQHSSYSSQPRPSQPQQSRTQQQHQSRIVSQPHSHHSQHQSQSQSQHHSHAGKHQQQQQHYQQQPVPRRPSNIHSRLDEDNEQLAFPPLPLHSKEEEEKEQEADAEPLSEAEEGISATTLHITHSWADIVQNEHKHNNTLAPVTTTSTSRPRSHSHSSSTRRQQPLHSPLSAAYFASLLPVNKEQQKHIDRQSRHAHDVAHCRDSVISVLSCILEQLFPLKETETLPTDASLITMFHTERVPAISISQYLQRLATYTECSSEVLIQSIIHINRILHHRPSFKINSLNIHRLLLTSLLCSAKFFDDLYYNNAYYAKVGGISNRELNELEIEFLALINFDLFVEFSVYQHFYNELKSDKLHQHCQCQYHGMPEINIKAYQLPEECKWEEDEECEDEVLEENEVVADEKSELGDGGEEEEGEEDEEDVDTVAAILGGGVRQHGGVRGSGMTTLSPSTTASSSSSDEEDEDDEEDVEDVVESEEEVDERQHVVPLLAGDKAMAIAEPESLDRQSSSASTLSVSRSMDSLAVDNLSSTVPADLAASLAATVVAPISAPAVFVAQSAIVAMSDSPLLASRNPAKLEQRSVIRDITAYPMPVAAAPPAHITYQQYQVAEYSEYFYAAQHHYVSVEGFQITPHPYYMPPPPPPPPQSYQQHAYYQPPPPPPSHPLMNHINGQTHHTHPHSHPTSQLHTPILGSVM